MGNDFYKNSTLHLGSGDYATAEDMFTSFSHRFHGCRKEKGFKELEAVYKNTPELSKNIHKCIRPNIMVMAAKRRLEQENKLSKSIEDRLLAIEKLKKLIG